MKRKLITLLTVICMLCTMSVPVFGAENPDANKLSNPRTSGDIVTWDCVQFGHYPQSMVKESDDVYQTLKNAQTWDENNELELNGSKYRKAQMQDEEGDITTNSPWGYYKYDPIKWRVLSVNGDEALLLADKNMDVKPYNETETDVTWETSTIRSWLNGYGSAANGDGKDYDSDNFISKAFSSDEQSMINQKVIQNLNNAEYGIKRETSLEDKIFLLSIDEVKNSEYGFPNHGDEITTREAVNTAYTASRNSYMASEGSPEYWWLRSPSGNSRFAAFVGCYGYVHCGEPYASYGDRAIRPALYLNLKSSLWSYAGTVSGDKNSGDMTDSLHRITVSKNKKTYKINETLDVNDLMVTAFYDDGSSKIVTNYTTNVNAIDMATPGNKTLTITYTEGSVTKETSVTIIVEQQDVNVTQNNNGNVKPAATTAKPKTVTLKKAASTKKGTLKLTWKRDKKATGYQAVVATDKKFKKNKKTAVIKKNKTVSKTFTKLKRKKVYYAKARAYKQVGKTKVYGAYSKVKKARVK